MSKRDFLILIALMFLWGVNFIAIKIGADQFDPLLLTALRFTFAALPIIFFIKRPKVHWGWLLAYGSTFGLGVWGMMVWSISLGLSAGMAGLLLDMSIVFSLVLAVFVLKEKAGWPQWAGVTLAVIGLLMALQVQDGSVPLAVLPLTLIAALSWSLMTLVVKQSGTKDVFTFSVWGMAMAAVILLIAALARSGTDLFNAQLLAQFNKGVWFSILFQAYPTTLLGYWVWNRMTLKYGVSKVSMFPVLTPVFGMLASVVIYGEQIDGWKVAAFALILLGFACYQLKSDYQSPRVRA